MFDVIHLVRVCACDAREHFFSTHDLLMMVTDVAIVVAVPTTCSPVVPFSCSFVDVFDPPDFIFIMCAPSNKST
jgi:hypothetical protein